MTIRHHPDDATLLAYAAGAVTEGIGLVAAAHLELCPQCRGRVRDATALGGALLDTLDGDPLGEGALAKVLARIDAEAEPQPAPRPSLRVKAGTTDGLPATLAPWLPQGLDGVPWRTLAPGVRHFRLAGVDSGGGTVRLLAIAPGTALPHHGHGGIELTLVLRGSFADEVGRFAPGDLADLDPSVQHQPVADTQTPCICLIATDARLRFSGVLGRLFQPLAGI
jgi:putative transcriptional regulator